MSTLFDIRAKVDLPAIVAEHIAHATPHDRIEDMWLPGGLCRNTCFACNHIFYGHPSRTACAVCAGHK